MKIGIALMLVCFAHVPVSAAEIEPDIAGTSAIAAAADRSIVQATGAKHLLTLAADKRTAMETVRTLARSTGDPIHESQFSLAIARSARKGIIELGVEAYTEVLIECQNERSPTLTMPFLRSDSQQSHCFRF